MTCVHTCEKRETEELLSKTTLPIPSEKGGRIADEAAESVD